eukprot:1199706-Pyramimonas_sp.AAC.1
MKRPAVFALAFKCLTMDACTSCPFLKAAPARATDRHKLPKALEVPRSVCGWAKFRRRPRRARRPTAWLD